MAANKLDHEFEISLQENGIDFILKGISELFDSEDILGDVNALDISSEGYKYGILHLFSGFLLLLKERLYRHMPELMYKGKYEAVRQHLLESQKSGTEVTLNTVDLDEALERLATGPRVEFSNDEMKILRNMQHLRNTIEHYKGSFNKYKLWSVVTKFLSLIDRFLTKELTIHLEHSIDNEELYRKVAKIESVRLRITTELRNALIADLDERLDYFKEYRDDILQDLRIHYFEEKGQCELFMVCPSCGEEALIIEGEYSGICSNSECGDGFLITTCSRCSSVVTTEATDIKYGDHFALCEACNDFIHKD